MFLNSYFTYSLATIFKTSRYYHLQYITKQSQEQIQGFSDKDVGQPYCQFLSTLTQLRPPSNEPCYLKRFIKQSKMSIKILNE